MVSKVLHVASGDLWAGAEVQIWMLVRNLKQQGLNVGVLLLNDGELARRLRKDQIAVYILDESSLGFLALTSAARRIVRDFQPDIIHSHRLKEHLIAALCRGLNPDVQMFRTVHGNPEFSPSLPQRILRTLDRWFARRSWAHTIAVSAPMLPILQAQLGASKVSLVENAVDSAALLAAVAAGGPTLAPGHIHFGMVGRLEPVKRVDRFIQAAIDHHRMQPDSNWQFHIIGDGATRPALEQQVQAAGIAHRVTFHGHVNNSAPLLAQLHAVIMCSEHEGMPMVALETLALGRHLICNGVGGLDSLKRFKGCHIYDQADPGALLAALNALASVQALQDEQFLKYFSADLMATKMRELYCEEQIVVAACP